MPQKGSLQPKFATRPKTGKILHVTDFIFLVGATDKKYSLTVFSRCLKFMETCKSVKKKDLSHLSLEICQVCSLELLPLNLSMERESRSRQHVVLPEHRSRTCPHWKLLSQLCSQLVNLLRYKFERQSLFLQKVWPERSYSIPIPLRHEGGLSRFLW